MSRQTRLAGLDQALGYFDRLPSAAHEELIVETGLIGREILAAQQHDVAKKTGLLESSLSILQLKGGLQLKIGLGVDDRFRKTVSAFYGRFVEFGRRAQTVLVTRRLVRKVKGNGRNGRKRRVIYDGKGYTLRVKAMAPRPYVAQPLLAETAELHLSDFWANALTRAGAN